MFVTAVFTTNFLHGWQEKLLDFAKYIDELCPAHPQPSPWFFAGFVEFSATGCVGLDIFTIEVFFVQSAPERLRRHYATEYAGPAFLRPWMLAFRKDTGCSGMVEPEVATRIMESIMVEGLLDANLQ